MNARFKFWAWLLLVLAAAFSIYWLTVCARPLDEKQLLPDYTGEVLGCDFYMRYNEIECLRSGIDPYDVWDERIPHEKYVSNRRLELRTPEWYEPINAYTPWSYVFFMPLNLLPRTAAWGWYYALMVLATLGWAVAAFLYGKKRLGTLSGGAWVAAIALMVGPALGFGIICANYTVVLAGAFALLVFALSLGGAWGEILASLALAVAMTKPQLAILATLPLMFKQRWRVLISAAVVCLAATWIASNYCGKSVITLILEAPQGNVFSFKGCGLMPKVLYDLMVGWGIREGHLLVLAAILGFAGCAWVTWRIRKSTDWFQLLTPAMVFSVAWTYVQPPSHLIAWLPLSVVAVDLVSTKSWRRRGFDLVLIFCLARLYYLPIKFLQLAGVTGCTFDAVNTILSDASAALAVLLLMVDTKFSTNSKSV